MPSFIKGGEEKEKVPSGQNKPQGRDFIKKSYAFKDFSEAFAFMNSVGPIADLMDHHPEWTNVDNKVEVVLSTHDCGGISIKDLLLAQAMEIVEQKVKEKGVTNFLDSNFATQEEILAVYK